LRHLLQQSGPKGLFKGLSASLLGTSHAGIQFPVYERLKVCVATHNGSESCGAGGLLLASSVSKLIATVITYPHQVVRTRLHMSGMANHVPSLSLREPSKPGLVSMVNSIIHREGWRGFYNGMSANLIQVVPSCAVTFTTFELVLRWLST
jgi:solute carrier family 25 folate transporter 32